MGAEEEVHVEHVVWQQVVCARTDMHSAMSQIYSMGICWRMEMMAENRVDEIHDEFCHQFWRMRLTFNDRRAGHWIMTGMKSRVGCDFSRHCCCSSTIAFLLASWLNPFASQELHEFSTLLHCAIDSWPQQTCNNNRNNCPHIPTKMTRQNCRVRPSECRKCQNQNLFIVLLPSINDAESDTLHSFSLHIRCA